MVSSEVDGARPSAPQTALGLLFLLA